MDITREIKKDRQITKFGLYGFLVNLRFFEPFLVIYLLSLDISLFRIGILYSIREIINYIFEIPSGIFADNYGKKTELYVCFILYIISFILFFVGGSFFIICLAMAFFGLGQAFRSGTHKAIILSYLEEKGWFTYKSFVYGRTRSFSLIGSAISSFASVVFLLSFSNLRGLFLLCVIPYLLNLMLILSYPSRFNDKHKTTIKIKDFLSIGYEQMKSVSKNKAIKPIIFSSSIFDAITKSIKDYIQPILQAIILASSITIIKSFSQSDNLAIYLSIIYGIIYLLSSVASKNVYRLNKYKTSARLMGIYMDVLAVVFLLLAFFISINAIYIIVLLYLMIYLLKDSRRPLFVDAISDIMQKQERVTVLSIESQMKALFMAIFAPVFGFIADRFSISFLFLVIGVFCLVINRFKKIHIA